MTVGRRRVVALLLAVVAFGMAGLGSPAWFPAGMPLQPMRSLFFWLGVVCFLVAAWGRGGT